MDELKPWWASRTIWGAIVTVASTLAGLFGVTIDAATQTLVLDNAMALVSAIGAFAGVLISIYGRVRATKQIG